jgi:hypothetical protein
VEDTPTSVIAVVLSETEWQALRTLEREPVDWLRQTILERLRREEQGEPPVRTPTDRVFTV